VRNEKKNGILGRHEMNFWMEKKGRLFCLKGKEINIYWKLTCEALLYMHYIVNGYDIHSQKKKKLCFQKAGWLKPNTILSISGEAIFYIQGLADAKAQLHNVAAGLTKGLCWKSMLSQDISDYGFQAIKLKL
jgi:hypothetical protein